MTRTPPIDILVVEPEPLGDKALADLRRLVPQAEVVGGVDALAAREAPGVLVSADRILRAQAAERGWIAAPHPALAPALADGDKLVFARIAGALEAIAELPGLVPYWVEHRVHGSPWALAALSRAGVAQAIDARLELQVLPLDVGLEDPLFVQLDEGASSRRGAQRLRRPVDGRHAGAARARRDTQQRRDPGARRARALPLPHAESRAPSPRARLSPGRRRDDGDHPGRGRAAAGDAPSPISRTSRATPGSRRSTRRARCARATARTPTTRVP